MRLQWSDRRRCQRPPWRPFCFRAHRRGKDLRVITCPAPFPKTFLLLFSQFRFRVYLAGLVFIKHGEGNDGAMG